MPLKGEIPFVRFLIPYLFGILLAWYCPTFLTLYSSLTFLFVLILVFLTGLIFYKSIHGYRFRWIFGLFVHFFLLMAAYCHTLMQLGSSQTDYFTRHPAKTLLVKINSEPVLRADIARFEVEVMYADRQQVQGQLLIALKIDSTRAIDLNYGDFLAIPSVYHEVEPPYNPGEFDFKHYLKTRKIEQQCFINQQQIVKIASHFGNPLISFALSLRQKIVRQFKKHIQNPEAAALASTLIMGYRADLSPEILSNYSKTGTMHVLSVSGMHVALVFIMLGFLLKPFDKIPRMRLLKAFILIGMIWFYALITGFSPSVNRAALMLSFVVLGKAISKSMSTYNLLAISAFILLLIEPFYLFDVGFQLSYLAVYGLVFLHPHIYQTLYIRQKWLDAIWSYTSLSIAAQFITFPLSLYIFHQFPLYFLISNLLIVIPVTLLMYVGIAFVLLLPFHSILPFLGSILNFLINLSNQMLQYLAHLPFSSLQGIWIDKIQLLLLYILSFAFVLGWIDKRKSALFIAFISTLALLGLNAFYHLKSEQKQELIFYSLRKNSAIAYIHGNEYELITDLKPDDKAYAFSVKPSLERSGLHLKHWLRPNAQVWDLNFCSNGHFIQLGNYRVLRWTPDYNFKKFAKTICVDAVFISGNPKIKLVDLKKWVHFDRLFIDATNPDYRIKQWIEEAEQLRLKFDVLKKNPAVVLTL